jgi:hypothetical protein
VNDSSTPTSSTRLTKQKTGNNNTHHHHHDHHRDDLPIGVESIEVTVKGLLISLGSALTGQQSHSNHCGTAQKALKPLNKQVSLCRPIS